MGPDEDPPPTEPVFQRDLVVMGASAGGVDALQRVVAGLPPELPAAVLIVLHLMPSATSVLADILDRAGDLPARVAEDGERFDRGTIYVAPPDAHLLVRNGLMTLSRGPRENGHRPAVDPLFRSAARARGEKVIGVVLSGALDDGTAGLRLINENGGALVVQDPEDAEYPDMPRNAIEHNEVDHVAPADEIAGILCELLDVPIDAPTLSDPEAQEPDIVEVDLKPETKTGDPTNLTCPECGGVLWENEAGSFVRFTCQVGHGFSPESLVAGQWESLEAALWSALRSLEERSDLLRRMARRSRRGMGSSAPRLESRADAVERHAAVVRDTILRLGDAGEPDDDDVAAGTGP